MEKKKTNVLIIGSGPAGYTAAIYASRANLKPIVVQGIQPGGQLTITTEVENYPGFPHGIQGPELMQNFEQQAQNVGAEIIYGTITKVNLSKRPFLAYMNDDELEIEAKTIIISTGASAKWLGLPSEQKFNGFGVSACAVCDGFFFKNQDVAIVGAGDTAAEEALYLSKICSFVNLLVRRDAMRASKIMQDRILNATNIKVHWNTIVDEVLGDKKVHSIKIQNIKTNQFDTLSVKGLFIAIGHQPNSQLFTNQIQTDEQGYIITKPGTTQTNIEGVFASGDIQDKTYRQAVTAAGSGCMAALEAERFLTAVGDH
ncbi:MAG: thioredoxin-disulfide reductase [Alphaproteobacteria bacterium]|nr:thioredoxin-disulfide reductase [Alphaproteobacteria bacterium]